MPELAVVCCWLMSLFEDDEAAAAAAAVAGAWTAGVELGAFSVGNVDDEVSAASSSLIFLVAGSGDVLVAV